MSITNRALDFAAKWFDEKTYQQTFVPLIADWQREWLDAAPATRWSVSLRAGIAFILSVIVSSPNVLFAAAPAGVTRRVVTRLAIWTTVFTALNVFPFARDFGDKIDVVTAAYLLVLLVPQALAVAFPTAITTVLDLIRTAPRPTREERIASARLAVMACALMFLLAGWVFPAANQQFRVTMNATVHAPRPVRGMNELTLVELFKDDRLTSYRKGTGDPIFDAWVATGARAEPVLSAIVKRFFIALLPVMFLWMRWRALLLPRGHWYSATPLIISAPLLSAGCFALMAQNRALADFFYAPRWAGLLLVFPVLAIAAIGIDRVRRRAAGLA